MSHEVGVHKEHRNENHRGITSADRFRGQFFERATSGSKDIIATAKKWAEIQHHMLLLRGQRIKNRKHRRKDPDMWS